MNLYEQAVAQFGADSQVNMAIEECAELITALRHYARGKVSIGHVADEIADVEIMMRQLRVIIGDRAVDDKKYDKKVRLARLLACNRIEQKKE